MSELNNIIARGGMNGVNQPFEGGQAANNAKNLFAATIGLPMDLLGLATLPQILNNRPDLTEQQNALPGSTPWIADKIGADTEGLIPLMMQMIAPGPGELSTVAKLGGKMSPDIAAALAAMTAHHGSPHKFSKFDLSKIGTGEGAQAYGHGLYFAESDEVAGGYRARLAGAEQQFQGKKLGQIKRDETWLIDESGSPVRAELTPLQQDVLYNETYSSNLPQSGIEQAEKFFAKKGDTERAQAARELLDMFGHKEKGHLYEVDIPDEAIAKMLDWDKPLSEQPESVRKAT